MPVADPSLAPSSPAQLFDALIESTDGAIVTTNLAGVIRSWDGTAERMYGFSAEEAVGQPLSLYVPADRAGETVRCLHSVASGDRVGPVETVRIGRDKTRMHVSFTASAIHDPPGRIAGALFVERDIAALRAVEESLVASRVELADSQEFLDKAERLSQTSSWTLQLTPETLLVCSPESYRILGLAEGTPMSVELFFSFVHPDDRQQVETAMTLALTEHRAYEVEYRMVCADQSTRWVHSWAEAEFDALGEPLRVLGVVQDITERHHTDEALRASERRFRLLAENARDLIFRYTLVPEAGFDYVSPSSTAITGYTPEELYADASLSSALITPLALQQIEDLVAGRRPEPVDIAVHRKDGTLVWVSHQLTLEHDAAGELIAVEGIVRDVTDRKRAEEERGFAGLHDRLTGLPNRALLRERLDLLRSRAGVDGRSVIVVSLDLDDFTLTNDTHGHEAGDAVLVGVAALLTAASGNETIVARTGSDEFVIIGDDVRGGDAAKLLVDRIRNALRAPIAVGDVELFVRTHIGVAVGDPAASCDSLLRSAEIALGYAKRRTSGTGVEFFTDEMRTRAIDRLALVAELQHAVARSEFEILYQPIVRLRDNRIIKAEALLRWRHPVRGIVSPADFVPLAEDTGLIVEIGAWVLDQACAQLRDWSDRVPALARVGIAVNLSVKQLRSEGIVSTIARAVTRAGIDPARLTVEMTESVAVDDLDRVREILTELRNLGVRTALDDFGTGYSSLAYLKNLPLDTLKIDQVFVAGLGDDPRDSAIVASTIAVSKALGLFTVAEGVETPLQLAALRELGCDAAQGYLFFMPLRATELETRMPT
jgi:diguanylate cyclase (GGDEF)-like protein/PAS domain S-box-containing protein